MSNTIETARRVALSSVAALLFAAVAVCSAVPVLPIA